MAYSSYARSFKSFLFVDINDALANITGHKFSNIFCSIKLRHEAGLQLNADF